MVYLGDRAGAQIQHRPLAQISAVLARDCACNTVNSVSWNEPTRVQAHHLA